MASDILIVDDENDIRELVAGILSDEGHETRTAHDADSALAAQGIRGYLATLEGVAPEVTPVEARRIAPALQEDADRVALAFGRLSAGRLDDARLEEQRTAVTPILGELAKTMDRGAQAAAEGRTRQLVALLPALRTGLETLRTSLAAG